MHPRCKSLLPSKGSCLFASSSKALEKLPLCLKQQSTRDGIIASTVNDCSQIVQTLVCWSTGARLMQGRKHQCSYPITACRCTNGTKKQQCSYPITTRTDAQAASNQRAVLRLNRRPCPRGGCEPRPRLPGPADEGSGGPPPGRPGAERAPVPRNTSTPSMPAPRVQRSTATAPKARQGALPRSPAAASRPPTGSVWPQALANLSAGHKGPWSWRYLAGQYHATDGAPPSVKC